MNQFQPIDTKEPEKKDESNVKENQEFVQYLGELMTNFVQEETRKPTNCIQNCYNEPCSNRPQPAFRSVNRRRKVMTKHASNPKVESDLREFPADRLEPKRKIKGQWQIDNPREKYHKIFGFLVYNDFSDEAADTFVKILIQRGSLPESPEKISEIFAILDQDVGIDVVDVSHKIAYILK
tara:strand:+ start:1361 stop:1900 length:540 start_codon:yes stop_codon:yes gene_type:complete